MPALQIQGEWTGLPGSPGLTTVYTGEGTIASPQATADAVLAIFAALGPFISNEVTFTLLPEARVFSTPDTVTSIVPITTDDATGTAVTSPLSGATQGLIKGLTQTFNGNRRVQGRLFIPGPTTNQLASDAGVPAATYVTALTAAGTDLVSLGWQIASRSLNQFAPVTSALGWNKFAVLRSRRD